MQPTRLPLQKNAEKKTETATIFHSRFKSLRTERLRGSGIVCWGAHAARVLASASSRPRTLLQSFFQAGTFFKERLFPFSSPMILGSRQAAETYTLAACAPRNTNARRVLSTIHANGTREAIPKNNGTSQTRSSLVPHHSRRARFQSRTCCLRGR